jgi:hypothetical protein
MGFLQDAEKGDFSAMWSDVVKGWEGSSVGSALDAAAAAAWAELKLIGPSDLLGIVENVGTSILSSVAAGNPTSAIISEGISIAEAAFKTAGAQVASTTLSTFVSAIHNQTAVEAPVSIPPQPATVAAAPAV